MIKIDSKENCIGCNACKQKCPKHCISIIEDNEGFKYPKVNLKDCIDCHACEAVCPVLNSGEPLPPLETYATYSNSKKTRLASSSGGIFYEICKIILLQNGVVFGAQFNEYFEVVTSYTESLEDVTKFQGSKYVQTDNSDSYTLVQQFLKDGRKVLYSGTPCQIKGLRNFLGKNYDSLLCIDFVCHGVPSPLVCREYLRLIQNDKSFRNLNKCNLDDLRNIKTISFRDKKNGWRKYCMSITTCDESTYYSSRNHNLYMKSFLNDIILRPSCYHCRFKSFSSGSDITLCDFWGIEGLSISQNIPVIKEGVSGLFINSKKGAQILNQLNVTTIASNVDDLLLQNPSINFSTHCPANRNIFFEKLSQGHDIIRLMKKYGNLPLKRRIRAKMIRAIQKIGLFNIIKRIHG